MSVPREKLEVPRVSHIWQTRMVTKVSGKARDTYENPIIMKINFVISSR